LSKIVEDSLAGQIGGGSENDLRVGGKEIERGQNPVKQMNHA
jgi:hypothetical protein